MGYTTEFNGVLKFNVELRPKELAHLKKFFGEDGREHPEWKDNPHYMKDWYYLDLDLNEDFDGIQWSGAEKSYGMVDQVNFLIVEMRKLVPNFGLIGRLSAQGEDSDDSWTLDIGADGWATRVENVKVSTDDMAELQKKAQAWDIAWPAIIFLDATGQFDGNLAWQQDMKRAVKFYNKRTDESV